MAYNKKEFRRNRIKMRVRKKISGTQERPRMSIYRSNRDIYVQIIDDIAGCTLVSASSAIAEVKDQKITKIQKSALVGKAIAEKAEAAGIKTVVFDRNGYLYHGRVKSLAEAAREGGLNF
ncbi:MAG: 50S ribosomal protein L18 [Bacteroidales bacterium]|jgi:large subunit ribosomal protein L18|nr:50S ribosomal protein L18 [Bacteroidales bacterium]